MLPAMASCMPFLILSSWALSTLPELLAPPLPLHASPHRPGCSNHLPPCTPIAMTSRLAEVRQNQQRQAGQQPRRLRGSQGGKVARALALALALAAALPRAAAVKGLSPWTSGLITHYGGAQDGE